MGPERGKNKFFFKKPADDYPITGGQSEMYVGHMFKDDIYWTK